jgi:glycosyltransferase involved in cell wall biosynthesis
VTKSVKKRVLYVDQSDGTGGASRSLLTLVAALDRSRFEPLLALREHHPLAAAFRAAGAEVALELPAVPPLPIDARPGLTGDVARAMRHELVAAVRLRRFVRRARIDLVHHNSGISRDRTSVLIIDAPQVCHMRNFRTPTAFTRLAARRAAAFVYVSAAVERFFAGLGLPRGRVIYDGIDAAAFAGAEPLPRAALGVAADDLVVSNVGRLDVWKGSDVFLQAMAQVVRAEPRARGLIVGPVTSADFAARLRTMVSDLGLGDRIVFTGARDDVPRIMATSDVIVHAATRPEPFGLVVAEALAAARPVIATRGGGVPEIVEDGIDGIDGILVTCGAPDEMAAAILWTLRHRDEALRRAAAAQQRIGRFAPRLHAAAMQDLYDEVLRNRR